MTVLRSDPCTNPDPEDLWGDLTNDMVDLTRHELIATGGPTGGPFRRITVQDGDVAVGSSSAERAELGNNERRYGLASAGDHSGTFFLYGEGDRRITSYWLRLGSDWPLASGAWQVVTQLKQTQPYAGASSSSPILSLEARSGSWRLIKHDPGETILWSTLASVNQWVKVTWDVTYSKDPALGRVKLTIGSKTSGFVTARTLAYVTLSGSGLAVNDPIPSHLRVGPYHNDTLGTTHLDVADVLVEDIPAPPVGDSFTLRTGVMDNAIGAGAVDLDHCPAGAVRLMMNTVDQIPGRGARSNAVFDHGLWPVPCLKTQAVGTAAAYRTRMIELLDIVAPAGGPRKTDVIEVGNEPGQGTYPPGTDLAYYLDCLKNVYDVIRARGVKVVLAAMTQGATYTPPGKAKLYASRAVSQAITDGYRGVDWSMVDMVAWHFYTDGVTDCITTMINLRKLFPASKRALITENGWPSPGSGGPFKQSYDEPKRINRILNMWPNVRNRAWALNIGLWGWFANCDGPGGDAYARCGLVKLDGTKKSGAPVSRPPGPSFGAGETFTRSWDALNFIPKETTVSAPVPPSPPPTPVPQSASQGTELKWVLTDLEGRTLSMLTSRLPGGSVQVGLNDQRTAHVSVPIEDEAAGMVKAFATALKVYLNDDLIFRGPVITPRWAGGSALQGGAAGPLTLEIGRRHRTVRRRHHHGHRRIPPTGEIVSFDPEGGGGGGDTVEINAVDPSVHLEGGIFKFGSFDFVALDQSEIVNRLAKLADQPLVTPNSGTFPTHASGIVTGSLTSSFNRTRRYSDGTGPWESMTEMAELFDGVDFELEPIDTEDENMVQLNTYYPRQGTNKAASVFFEYNLGRHNLAAFAWEPGGGKITNVYTVAGKPTSTVTDAGITYETGPAALAWHPASMLEFGTYEDFEADPDIPQNQMLLDRAKQIVAARALPTDFVEMTPAIERDARVFGYARRDDGLFHTTAHEGLAAPPRFAPSGDYWIGDTVRVLARQKPGLDLSTTVRITEATITEADESGVVVVELTASPRLVAAADVLAQIVTATTVSGRHHGKKGGKGHRRRLQRIHSHQRPKLL
jgi:hypothetical protein